MHDYKLVILPSAEYPMKPIVMQSDSAASALALAHRHHGRSAELWCKDELLCRMTYAPGGFWIIHAHHAIPPEECRRDNALPEAAPRGQRPPRDDSGRYSGDPSQTGGTR
jgi:hypothetical protein